VNILSVFWNDQMTVTNKVADLQRSEPQNVGLLTLASSFLLQTESQVHPWWVISV
jgi:hypothetical protein